MNSSSPSSIIEKIGKVGFRGKHLLDLSRIVKDEEGLQDLYNFILLNEGLSKSLIVSRFISQHINRRSYIDHSEFTEVLSQASTSAEKQTAVKKLFVVDIEDVVLVNKLISLVEEETITPKGLYDVAIKYRNLYSVKDVIILIENSFI